MSIYASGTIINNRYEVVQGPGGKPSLAGGMGLVYLCVDHAEDGKPVALKTFRPELISNRDARDRFLREGTTWMQLGYHPHIVHCYNVFKANVGLEVFFALELVATAENKKDASLRSWLIPGKPLPLEQAFLFALHICRGMGHATTKIPGFVHRDLKPENILIGRDGRARVTDFGLASAAQNLGIDRQMEDDKSSSPIRTQLTHGIAGTPLYMAPEQWVAEPLDERADIYAFGCILYEMICGSFAVTGKSLNEWKQSHCQGQLNTIPAKFSPYIISLLQRCLALNAGDRYHNWTELEIELINAYTSGFGKPVSAIFYQEKDSNVERITIGWSYNAIGISYCDICKFVVARDYFEKVLTIARQYRDRVLEGTALGNLGNAYCQLSDPNRAIEFYEKFLVITRLIGDRHKEGQALANLGNALFQLGDIRRAIQFYEQDLVIAREISDRQGEGKALGNMGSAYYQLSDARSAINFYIQSITIAREIGDFHAEGQTLGNLGNAYADLGDIRQAIEFYEKQLTIARRIGDPHTEEQALGNLGTIYRQLGDICRAIEFYEQCLAIAQEIKDIKGEGQTLGNLGTAYRQLGDTRRAIEFNERRLIIAREIGDRHGEEKALGSLGNVYADLGDFHRAIEFYEKRLTYAREIGDRKGEGVVLGNLGNAYRQLGDLHSAIELYEQGLVISTNIGDIMTVASIRLNMALFYQYNNPLKALDYANEAFRLFKQMSHEQYAAQAQSLINEIRG